MDYESQWNNEIAEQWVTDFVLLDRFFDEISVDVTDPEGDTEPDTDEFEIKNVIFTIDFKGEPVQLWVFYDIANEEMADVEMLDNQDVDELAEHIFNINERWKKIKAKKYPD